MPQRSKVVTLPDDIKAALDKKLVKSGFRDYTRLSNWLAEQGYEISKSSVHRYGSEFEQRIAALKIATEQAQAIAEATADDPGMLGDALTRLCQEKAFQVLVKMQDPAPDSVDLNKLGIMVSRLNRASVTQKKWMLEARSKIEATAGEVKKAAKAGGLTDEKADEIYRKILKIV